MPLDSKVQTPPTVSSPHSHNNGKSAAASSQAEDARLKKLEFFRALGQATLEDLEQQELNKPVEEKPSKIISMSLFDSSIVSLSSKSKLITYIQNSLCSPLTPDLCRDLHWRRSNLY